MSVNSYLGYELENYSSEMQEGNFNSQIKCFEKEGILQNRLFFRSCKKLGAYKIVASVSYILTDFAQPHKPFLSTWEQVQRPGAESRKSVSCSVLFLCN